MKIEALQKSRNEAIDSMKDLIVHHVDEIMSARAMLLKVEGVGGEDTEPLRKEIDECIAEAGRNAQAKYDGMEVQDILLEKIKRDVEEGRIGIKIASDDEDE